MRSNTRDRLVWWLIKAVTRWLWSDQSIPRPGTAASTGAAQAAPLCPTPEVRENLPIAEAVPRRGWSYGASLLSVAAATAALRLIHLDTAYELFLDEAIYTQIAQNVNQHFQLAFHGTHFYVHPPLHLLLQAGFERATSIDSAGPIRLIDDVRFMCVIFAVGNAILVFIITDLVSSRLFGLIAGAAYAVDPFTVRFDSRVLLETSAVFWALFGVAILLTTPAGRTVTRGRGTAAGVAFGLSLLTKETAAALYIVPMLVCLVRSAPIARRVALYILGVIAITFAPYPVIVFAVGDTRPFLDQQLNGLFRMIGLTQTTGYNAPGKHPSFTSRVIANLPLQYPSYLLIFAGFCALVALLRSGNPRERLVGLFALGGFALLSYQIAIGTLEEQMFYYLTVPSVVAMGSARRQIRASLGQVGGRILACLVAFSILSASVIWWHIHFVPDDGVRKSVRWVERAARPGDVIAPLVDTTQFLVTGHPLIESGRLSDLRSARARWVLTSSLQVNQGYGLARPILIRELRRNAIIVYRTRDRTMGTITVWRMRTVGG